VAAIMTIGSFIELLLFIGVIAVLLVAVDDLFFNQSAKPNVMHRTLRKTEIPIRSSANLGTAPRIDRSSRAPFLSDNVR
jgi:hypothetical protein